MQPKKLLLNKETIRNLHPRMQVMHTPDMGRVQGGSTPSVVVVSFLLSMMTAMPGHDPAPKPRPVESNDPYFCTLKQVSDSPGECFSVYKNGDAGGGKCTNPCEIG